MLFWTFYSQETKNHHPPTYESNLPFKFEKQRKLLHCTNIDKKKDENELICTTLRFLISLRIHSIQENCIFLFDSFLKEYNYVIVVFECDVYKTENRYKNYKPKI